MDLQLLIFIVVVWLVIGILLWGLTRIPLDGTVKNIIWVITICAGAIWTLFCLLKMFGVSTPSL